MKVTCWLKFDIYIIIKLLTWFTSVLCTPLRVKTLQNLLFFFYIHFLKRLFYIHNCCLHFLLLLFTSCSFPLMYFLWKLLLSSFLFSPGSSMFLHNKGIGNPLSPRCYNPTVGPSQYAKKIISWEKLSSLLTAIYEE